MMSYRGGERLARCLRSIAGSRQYFSRVILSITASEDSDDMRQARTFAEAHPGVEVICTGVELPTMRHQEFWVDYLEESGVQPTDWIFWLAYDDEVRASGIREIIDDCCNWPLVAGTSYFGPWAMRHEGADTLWAGEMHADLESWTSFPVDGPTQLPVLSWIDDQLVQPTYIQMSGSVNAFASFLQVRDGHPRKQGPMRIEMAVAATSCNTSVREFFTPVSTIYGRPNSDRAAYGAAARAEDRHLLLWLCVYAFHHPRTVPRLGRLALQQVTNVFRRRPAPEEEWRVRSFVSP